MANINSQSTSDEMRTILSNSKNNLTLETINEQLADVVQNLDNFPRLGVETDDTARIQRAIASFPSGGKLFIPAGTYTYNNISGNDLNLPSNFEVFLHPNATIQLTDSYYFIKPISKSNIKIFGGNIIGNGGTAGNDILFFGSCDRMVVIGTELQQSPGDGLNMETCTNSLIKHLKSHHNYKFAGSDQWGNNNVWENCLLNNNGLNINGNQIGANGRGLVFWMTKNCKSINNQIMNNTEYGFRFYSATGDTQNLEDCLVERCYFKDNAEVDLLFYDDGNTLYRNKAYNNTIERSLTTGTPITVTGHESEVKNNTITNLNGNQTLNAIYFTGADRPIVRSNRINGFDSAFGFSATSPQIPNNCLIKDNKIFNVANLVSGYVHGGGHIFEDNEVTHAGSGASDVGITLDGNTTSECFFRRNKLNGFYRAIVIDNSAQTIEDNVTTGSTGVGLFKNGTDLTNNHIGKNDFDSTYPAYLGALVQYKKGTKPRIAYYNGFPSGTTLSWDVGDTFINNTPSETGTAGSKYIVEAWTCTVAGASGTWIPKRVLTGN